jgi:hypothetical protein
VSMKRSQFSSDARHPIGPRDPLDTIVLPKTASALLGRFLRFMAMNATVGAAFK